MKNLYFLFFIALLAASYSISAQPYCGTDRYDKEVFTNYTSSTDITYGSAKNFYGSTTTLKMDIYQPSGDTIPKRPLIIWIHGGSFIGGDKLTNSDVVDLARKFSKRGYVTASINYRLLYYPLDNEVQAKKAVMRAVQDLKAAIRFFRKDAYTTNAYKIDTNNIFVAGSSAGAFTAMHHAYLDTDAEFAAEIDTTGLGGLEGNSGNPGYSSKAHAVVNLCGALGNSNYIVPGDEPLLSMHGTIDGTVPYATAPVPQVPSLLVYGSYSLNSYADSIGVLNSMYTWFGADHTPYVAGGTTADQLAYMDTTVRFISNFLYKVLQCAPTDPNPFPNTFVSGDVNGNNVIDGNEKSGDANKNGIYDNGEVAGDLNGNGQIDYPYEAAGDISGNGIIDGNEVSGDSNGNGSIDGTEVAGDINGDGVYNSADWLVSIENLEKADLHFAMSPNPAHSRFFIDFILPADEKISVEVFDIIGKKVAAINPKIFNSGKNRLEVNAENLNPGIYFVKVNYNGTFNTKKITVSK